MGNQPRWRSAAETMYKNIQARFWRPQHPEKYLGNHRNIVARSSYEVKAFNWCDSRSQVISWSSEEFFIPYRSPMDGKIHRYFVDLKFTIRNKDGTTTTYLAEIKPEAFTEPPKAPKRKTKRYLEEVAMWGVNKAKWAAAQEYCADRGYKFIILTERALGIK